MSRESSEAAAGAVPVLGFHVRGVCHHSHGAGPTPTFVGAARLLKVSNYFQSNDCTGSSISSESVLQGACTPRSSDKEARQYFPLVGVCNNASTAAFLQRYISETPLYGSAEEFPTDVCLSNGEAESKVYSIHEEKVFRVTYGNNNCTGSAESVNDITSRASIFGVFLLGLCHREHRLELGRHPEQRWSQCLA
ncbi:unnamed protein product [Durusdinium trenchii]|uniref:Subtilisin n=1 Tax=Durusdinium trenchii TaxID=1381693 RepID=A0ABP0T0N4_9DINO